MPTSPALPQESVTREQLEEIASDHAWNHRWDNWPSSWCGLVDSIGRHPSLGETYAVARRLHFHFAHQALLLFSDAALTHFPGDPFLTQLRSAARAATGDKAAWSDLVSRATTGSSKSIHILLTTAFIAAEVPDAALTEALELATQLATDGDPVAAYRCVSLLRRAGQLHDALTACDTASLAVSHAGAELGDHLAERLLSERIMLTNQLQEQNAQQQRPTS